MMAAGNYYSCDKCGCKTFYDAKLDYASEGDLDPPPNSSIDGKQWPDGNVGYMLVLCTDCAPKYAHYTIVTENQTCVVCAAQKQKETTNDTGSR